MQIRRKIDLLDLVGGRENMLFCFDFSRKNFPSNYTALKARRVLDNETKLFYYKDYLLPESEIETFRDSTDSYIEKIHDCVYNTLEMTQTTIANQPKLLLSTDTGAINNIACGQFTGVNAGTFTSLTGNKELNHTGDLTMFLVCDIDVPSLGGNQIFASSTGTENNIFRLVKPGGVTAYINAISNTGVSISTDAVSCFGKKLITLVFDTVAGTMSMYINGAIQSSSPKSITGGFTNQMRIPYIKGFDGEAGIFVGYKLILDNDRRQEIEQNLITEYNISNDE